MAYAPTPPLDRFVPKVSIDENGCWPWQGARDPHGYGVFLWNKKAGRAHRAAWELLVGPIPDGLVIDHLCRNPCCVNPDHLEPVTQRENMLRGFGVSGLAARRTHCPHGHPLDGRNKNGSRYCMTCNRLRSAANRAREKAKF